MRAWPWRHLVRWPLVFVISMTVAGCGASTTVAPTVPARPAPLMAQSAKPPTVTGAWLKVPAGSVRPGQRVTVSGYLPGSEPTSASAASSSFATLCFGGCTSGLSESAVSVHWSSGSKDHFTMTLFVPATAWMTPTGPQPLENGTYRVSLQCLIMSPGCALGPSEVSTVVHMAHVSYHPCPKTACGFISLSAKTGAPGSLVQFHGWAPLSEIIGTPFPYTLVMVPGNLSSSFVVTIPAKGGGTQVPGSQVASVQQALNGTFSGSLRIPAMLSSGPTSVSPGRYTLALQGSFNQPVFTDITFAPTAVSVSANQTWASLGPITPIASTLSASLYAPTVLASSSTPSQIAACVTSQIRLSTNGGQSWSVVPDRGVIQAAAKTSYPLAIYYNGTHGAPCISALADPAHPNTIYATFVAEFAPYQSIPPTFTVGYVTTNLGRTWSAVPAPSGYTLGDFGGFQADGATTLALFDRMTSANGPYQTALPGAVIETANGGLTWTSGQLACPALGPCLRFGAAPAQTGGMGVGYAQSLELSVNGGGSWKSPAWPSQVTLNQGPSQLVALTSSRALLLSGSSQYLLRLTKDGGQTWQNIALPPVPDAQNGAFGLNDALILPSGALLARDPNGQSWILLEPGQSAWCTLTGLPSGFVSQPVATSGRLWYVAGSATGSGEAVTSTPLSAIHCGG